MSITPTLKDLGVSPRGRCQFTGKPFPKGTPILQHKPRPAIATNAFSECYPLGRAIQSDGYTDLGTRLSSDLDKAVVRLLHAHWKKSRRCKVTKREFNIIIFDALEFRKTLPWI